MAQVDASRLTRTVLGTELDLADLKTLAGQMTLRRLEDGERLVSEGDDDRHLHVLVDGELCVSHLTQGGEDSRVYTMHAGECAGTAAFVEGGARLATLTARGRTTVYALAPERFEELLDSHPRIVYRVMRALFRARHQNLVKLYQEAEQLTNYITKTHGRY